MTLKDKCYSLNSRIYHTIYLLQMILASNYSEWHNSIKLYWRKFADEHEICGYINIVRGECMGLNGMGRLWQHFITYASSATGTCHFNAKFGIACALLNIYNKP